MTCGNRGHFLEVASMVVTWWIVAFMRSENSSKHTQNLEIKLKCKILQLLQSPRHGILELISL